MEPSLGLHPTTLGSWPGLKSRVGLHQLNYPGTLIVSCSYFLLLMFSFYLFNTFNEGLILNSDCSDIFSSVGTCNPVCCFSFEKVVFLKCLAIWGCRLVLPWRYWVMVMGSVDGWMPVPSVSSSGLRAQRVGGGCPGMKNPRCQQPAANHCSPFQTAFQASLCHQGSNRGGDALGVWRARSPHLSLRSTN